MADIDFADSDGADAFDPGTAPSQAVGVSVFAELAAMAQVSVTPAPYPGVGNPAPVTYKSVTIFVPLGVATPQPQAVADALRGMGLL